MSRPSLVLASTSPYRTELLGRLGLSFEQAAPEVDEAQLPEESPQALVLRLAEAKARVVTGSRPGAVVLGSDQCVDLGGQILGKPGGFEGALHQLRQLSGREAVFRTGICVLDAEGGIIGREEVPFTVVFRELDDDRIRHYLENEGPYDCAGSIRSEGSAPALMERTRGEDPTALMGLPLIRTARLLEAAGLELP